MSSSIIIIHRPTHVPFLSQFLRSRHPAYHSIQKKKKKNEFYFQKNLAFHISNNKLILSTSFTSTKFQKLLISISTVNIIMFYLNCL